MRMVARGAGLAIVPQVAIERRGNDLPFKRFVLKEDWAQRRLLLCARSFEGLPGYAKALLEALRRANLEP
ncbi:hypothetical protein D3C73_1151690 [compost metagenome]